MVRAIRARIICGMYSFFFCRLQSVRSLPRHAYWPRPWIRKRILGLIRKSSMANGMDSGMPLMACMCIWIIGRSATRCTWAATCNALQRYWRSLVILPEKPV